MMNVCGRVHCGPVSGFLVLCLQIPIKPFALLIHSVCDYMYFTVIFHR